MKSDDILKRTSELLGAKAQEKEQMKMQLENERRLLVSSIGQEIAQAIAPSLENMVKANQITIDNLREMLQQITIEVPPMPEVKIPPINIPRPQVTVNTPDVKVPEMNIPAPIVNIPERLSVVMDSVDNKRPLPVMMMGTDGKPMPFSMGAGGGGKADYLTIKDIRTSTGASLISDTESALKVTGSLTVVGSASSTLAQLANADGTYYDSDNPLPVTGSFSSGATYYASDAIASTNLIQVGGNSVVVGTGYQDNALRVVHATDAIASVNVVSSTTLTVDATSSGDVPITLAGESVVVSSITASTATNIVDSSGVAYSGSNPVPVSGTVVVSSVTATTASNMVDSSGVAYSGSNPVPVNLATALDQTIDSISVAQVSGAVFSTLSRPVQVRSALTTAYATLTNGTETTLATAVAGKYLDLVYIMGANVSDVATTVFLRAVTGGNILMALQLPANGTAGIAPHVPLPVSNTGNNWTADMGDITGTTVYLTGLFSQES